MKIPMLAALFLASLAICADNDDPLAQWRAGVQVKPALPAANRHTIHTYFNINPESPDGKKLLFFSSTARDAQKGEIHLLDRASGEEKTLVKNLSTEDAHRVACQQWISNGKRVAYHDDRNGEWVVAIVDVETGTEKVLAKNRLICWGQPNTDIVPLYSLHWNPGEHRDLELLNVESGEIKTVLTNDAVRAKYPQFISKCFGEKPTSIFFPILSPDLKRVFFKMAAAGNGDPRSKGASNRQGKICYHLEEKRFTYISEKWGHPAWHPDSKTIVETDNQLVNTDTGVSDKIPGLPNCGSGHPSASPDGKLIVSDTTLARFGGTKDEWGIVLMDVRGENHVIVHKFNNAHGARSWRGCHPHPVFSADGQRIYFNVSSGEWTQLHVAEAGKTSAPANK
jgi:Tol biopolymer transport system component